MTLSRDSSAPEVRRVKPADRPAARPNCRSTVRRVGFIGTLCRKKAAESPVLNERSDLLCSMFFGRTVLKISWLIRLAQAAFFAALIFTFYSAVIPPTHAVQLVPWDKAEHFIAFYALAGLAAAAFPKARLWAIALLLSAFGAVIEFVQGLPIVHRDRDFWDWVADSIAIIAALSPMLLVWWRALAAPGQKNIDT